MCNSPNIISFPPSDLMQSATTMTPNDEESSEKLYRPEAFVDSEYESNEDDNQIPCSKVNKNVEFEGMVISSNAGANDLHPPNSGMEEGQYSEIPGVAQSKGPPKSVHQHEFDPSDVRSGKSYSSDMFVDTEADSDDNSVFCSR